MVRRQAVFALIAIAIGCGDDVTRTTAGGQGGQGTGQGSGAGSTSGPGNGGGGAACGSCMTGFTCCDGRCTNPGNDILNCGGCNRPCQGTTPYCDNGACGMPPCAPNILCGPGVSCCNDTCCMPGQICCTVPGPIGSTAGCVNPADNGGTCPPGCTDCKCAAPDTPVATPRGERPIAELRPGDLVYSVDHDAIVAVPILAASEIPVQIGHELVEVLLATGRRIAMSPGHPTADGRTLGALAVGDHLDGVPIVALRRVPYPHRATYDIQPASRSGVYFAAGVAVGSTLGGR